MIGKATGKIIINEQFKFKLPRRALLHDTGIGQTQDGNRNDMVEVEQ